MNNSKQFKSAFITLVILFFMWGFLTSLNDILVPHLKAAFDLKHWQAQLVQFCFFGAFFIMSWPAGYIIKRFGYKNGIVAGLGLMGLGCLIFLPAATMKIYYIFLFALFVLASGVTILQVAANPYVAALGNEDTAASRLNLAQGFNSLGHTLAPIFGSILILGASTQVEVESVRMPYLGLGIVLLLLAGIFVFIKLPSIQSEEASDKKINVMKYPYLVFGAIAIFCYVGAEISVGSFLVEYFKLDKVLGLDAKSAGFYVSYYWGGAMIGRFLGAIAMSTAKDKLLRMIAIPVVAFVIVYLITRGGDTPAGFLIGFGIILAVNYAAFMIGNSIPSRLLAVFAAICVIMIAISMNTTGSVALWSILSIGMFNSIMWSNIFTLAIKKLGDATSFGSSFLIMMIVGGAIIPPIQGLIADIPSVGVNYSFIVPLVAYFYLIFYGLSGHKIGLKE